MTPQEFKEKYPQYSSLEGEELWNTMEDKLKEMGSKIHNNSFKGDGVNLATRVNIVGRLRSSLSPERKAEIKREIEEGLAFNRWLEEQGYKYNTDKSYSLKLLNDAGYFPIGITTMMGEETFIFKTETEANEAWNSHILGYDGWFYGEYSFKLAQEEYERDLDFKLKIYWL